MLVSFNELEARLKKAARGSGLPWGVAEEYAKSVLWLAHAGFELQGWAVDELETSGIEQSLLDWAYALDLTEAPQQSSSTPLTASQAMLWLGFVGRYAKAKGVIVDLGRFTLYPTGVSSPELPLMESLQIISEHKVNNSLNPSEPPRLRAEIEDDVWQRLGVLEFQTYAPDTEASRLKGAGAGLSDND